MRAGVPQGSEISPALFNYFMSDCPLSDYDMASYADDFTIRASSPKVDEAVVKANRLMTTLVDWAGRKELSIAPNKSSLSLLSVTLCCLLTLVHTYKAITRPVLGIASGNVLMAPISHLHSETNVLPLSMHLKLCGEQFYAFTVDGTSQSRLCHTPNL